MDPLCGAAAGAVAAPLPTSGARGPRWASDRLKELLPRGVRWVCGESPDGPPGRRLDLGPGRVSELPWPPAVAAGCLCLPAGPVLPGPDGTACPASPASRAAPLAPGVLLAAEERAQSAARPPRRGGERRRTASAPMVSPRV